MGMAHKIDREGYLWGGFVPYNNFFVWSPLFELWSELFVARERFTYDSTMLVLLRELALVKVWTLGLVSKHCNTVYAHFCYLLPCYFILFALQKPISTIHTTLVSPSLRRTSAPIQLTIVLVCWGHKRFLVFDCRVVWERPSSSYASHGLINLRSSTWGKFATVLQNSALGGPTRVYKKKVA